MRRRQRGAHHQEGSRQHLRSVNAKPTSRQQCCLTWKIPLAGVAALEVSGVAPFRPLAVRPCDVGIPAASRKTRGSHSAWGRRRGQSPSFSGQASSRGSFKRRCAILPASRWQQFWTSPETRAHSRRIRSGSGRGNIGDGIHRSSQRRRIRTGELQRLGGHAQVQRAFYTLITNTLELSLRRTRREYGMTLPAVSWSWQRHAKEHLHHHCGHFRTLRRFIVMVADTVDDGRIGGLERQNAVLCQICGILESAANDSSHDLAWDWPLLGLSDPDARPDVHWSPIEASGASSLPTTTTICKNRFVPQ